MVVDFLELDVLFRCEATRLDDVELLLLPCEARRTDLPLDRELEIFFLPFLLLDLRSAVLLLLLFLETLLELDLLLLDEPTMEANTVVEPPR